MTYVLHVITDKENAVCESIIRRCSAAAYAPSEVKLERQGGSWHERERLLLPGYVLVSGIALTDQLYHQIKDIDGVIRFLGDPPATLLPAEEAYWVSPSDFTIEGSTVLMQNGSRYPIRSINRHSKRVRISVPFGGTEKEIELSISNENLKKSESS